MEQVLTTRTHKHITDHILVHARDEPDAAFEAIIPPISKANLYPELTNTLIPVRVPCCRLSSVTQVTNAVENLGICPLDILAKEIPIRPKNRILEYRCHIPV